jgi:hypothetical protein
MWSAERTAVGVCGRFFSIEVPYCWHEVKDDSGKGWNYLLYVET